MPNTLREKVASGELATVMAAHNPLSARLAEEAGFDGIWASGFELSAAYGVPDASLLSFTQHLDMTRAIIEQVALPLVADLDTGYGNAINVGHVVGAYARAGSAAVVIEDKTFPKDTSLLAGARQELVRDRGIPGQDRGGAGGRCRARPAGDRPHRGADRRSRDGRGAAARRRLCRGRRRPVADPLEAEDPGRDRRLHEAWPGAIPLTIVPTAYPDLTEAKARALGKIGIMIYANHAVRAAVTAMRDIFAAIRRDGGIHQVDKRIVSVEEIFELQRVPAMKAAEKRYLR